HEILGRAIAGSGSEKPRTLIAPGTIKGMFHHRHNFNMSEMHPLHILPQTVRQFPVGHHPVSFFRDAHPGTKRALINRTRLIQAPGFGTGFHPSPVLPGVVQILYDRSRFRWYFTIARKGVGLVHFVSMEPGRDMILMQRSRSDSRDKALPD